MTILQLMIAVAGVLSGYNGSFEFKEPGQVYGDVPYVGMRLVCDTIFMYIDKGVTCGVESILPPSPNFLPG